jgi:hypothetical protein
VHRSISCANGLFEREDPSDRSDMRDAQESSDVPPALLFDRRRISDRRAAWRGGRRDSDWTDRPVGAWRGFERRVSGWRQSIAALRARSGLS